MTRPTLLVGCPWGAIANPRTLSGLTSHLIAHLHDHFDVCTVDSASQPIHFGLASRAILRLHRSLRPLRKHSFPGARTVIARAHSTWLTAGVAAIEPDAVLTFGCAPAAYYTARAPLFLYMDGVYRYKWMVYDWLSPRAIPPFELANIDNVDRRGLSHCTKALFTSAIITKACADLYPAFRDKMRPVGIGANVESGNLPSPRPPIDRALNLLFISTNFARKGGEVAIQVARALRTQFHDVTLHIVGDSPSDRLISAADPVVIHGWLDKTIPADRARFSSLLERIHVHLLPTRGDLSPHAICEMNALGVPTVAREIGGIGDLVKAGESGELLDDLAPDRWTSAVVRVIADYDRYSRNARDVYLREQNWPIVAARIAGEIHEELAVARASTAGARPRPVPAGGRRTAGA